MGKLIDNFSVPSTHPEMELITSFKEAKRLWSVGKIVGRASSTNFFLSQHSVERAIDKERFFGVAKPGGSILCRGDRDFHHLYLNFSDADVLSSLLNELPIETPLVADIIQRGNTHEDMVTLLSASGFLKHRILKRLIRPPQLLSARQRELPIETAIQADADSILADLETFFDRYSEQLPDLDEIKDAIGNHCILVHRENNQVTGFLFFEPSGRNSTLRYWFVNDEFRNQNVGSSLIRHYLAMSCSNSVSQLWVVNDNHNAINKYQYYGYVDDVLYDQILVRK
jgi:hypothetical protein